jgi:aminopeptidase N
MDISKDMTTPPGTIRRVDYTPPPFLIETVDLVVELGKETTGVVARLAVRRNPAAVSQPADLVLDGKKMELVSVSLDGRPAVHEVTPESLIVRGVPDRFSLEITTCLRPQDNTELTGLYKSRDLFCTQCEAEGFRRITYFLDRPDVMARYSTRIVADRALAPVLLSNGNLVDSGALESMKWDEDAYGREYDLDVFNIVAVDDFNMGAMENKGLNIFNSKLVLASPETATDLDFRADRRRHRP